jgi:hypothetical protein
MRIEEIENSNVLRHGQLLVVAKLWRWFNSDLEAGPVQFYRHRDEPVPGVRRVKHGKPFRHPRTTNERRASFTNDAIIDILESHGVAFKVRQKRGSHWLPNCRDDISLLRQRTWKKYRRTQRRNTGSIDAESTALRSGKGETVT